MRCEQLSRLSDGRDLKLCKFFCGPLPFQEIRNVVERDALYFCREPAVPGVVNGIDTVGRGMEKAAREPR